MKLPDEYIEYLKNGGDTEFETDFEFGGYVILEPLEHVDKFNRDIEINKYAPDYLAFGSDGGSEVFAFDKAGAIHLMPMIGMSPNDAIKISDSWKNYISRKI